MALNLLLWDRRAGPSGPLPDPCSFHLESEVDVYCHWLSSGTREPIWALSSLSCQHRHPNSTVISNLTAGRLTQRQSRSRLGFLPVLWAPPGLISNPPIFFITSRSLSTAPGKTHRKAEDDVSGAAITDRHWLSQSLNLWIKTELLSPVNQLSRPDSSENSFLTLGFVSSIFHRLPML